MTARTKLTPPDVARRWGVSPGKIIAWIRSGELRAVNVATSVGGRPRYLIDLADLAVFESRRAAIASPAPVGRLRRRRPTDVIEFF